MDNQQYRFISIVFELLPNLLQKTRQQTGQRWRLQTWPLLQQLPTTLGQEGWGGFSIWWSKFFHGNVELFDVQNLVFQILHLLRSLGLVVWVDFNWGWTTSPQRHYYSWAFWWPKYPAKWESNKKLVEANRCTWSPGECNLNFFFLWNNIGGGNFHQESIGICNIHHTIFLSEYDLSFFAYCSDGRSILPWAALLGSRFHIHWTSYWKISLAHWDLLEVLPCCVCRGLIDSWCEKDEVHEFRW